MGAPAGGREGGLMTEINVTPLVDVVLVLLVLMMVTATAIASRTIPLDLPRASAAEGPRRSTEPLVVAVDERGALYLGTEPATEEQVRARAQALASGDAQASAVVAADGRARHEAVVRALELLRRERIAKIAIVVRAEP